nr:piggyBac transposable element-derived protein 3 [Nomia melanderi]
MSEVSASDLSVFYQLLHDENICNYEVSSDGASTTCSDAELEIQDSEPDEFDAVECEEDVDAKNYTVSGRTWKYIPPYNNNITEFQSSLQNYTLLLTSKSENVQTIDECFRLFIDERIIDSIVLYTNKKANESMPPSKKWKPVDSIEIDAFLGILLLAGRFRESRERKRDLWRKNEAFSRPFYAATMSRDRFVDILKYIRFDDSATREERKANDKLAPLRDVTSMFTANCRDSYAASSVGSINEQLVGFRGRCPFKVYMPNKSGNCGIKIRTLCDARTFYCCNMDIYLGKSGNISENQQGHHVVKQLTDFWRNSNRTITTDNFFTDISLAEELLENKIFLVGTVRKTRPDLPKILTQTRDRQQFSSQFLFTHNLTLVSYVPKPRKCVVLLSSLHHELNISKPEQNYQPDIINFYNSTKGSVDVFDKLVKEYSCRRSTRRWPLLLFMHYVDIAAYNAFVIWVTKYPTWECNNTLKTKRKIFLEELAKKLVTNNIERRAIQFENREITFHKYIVNAIEATGRKIVKTIPISEPRKRSRCYICIGNDNKYSSVCDNCQVHICNLHSIHKRTILCSRCSDLE